MHQEPTILSRRTFLSGIAAGAANAALAACVPRGSGPLQVRPFGRTKHRSSRVLFGAYAFSSVTDADDVARTFALLEQFGVNHIDTAPSYGGSHIWLGTWMKDHRDDYFLATKTDQRTYDAAMRQIESSLETLQTGAVDLLQLHNLVDPGEWETAMGAGGALEAVLKAQEQGLTRFVGVTGHGVTAPAMHTRSLERHGFDSVLLPWNYPMARNPAYAADFESLLELCADRGVAVQIIKSTAHGGPLSGASRRYNTWYRPLEEQQSIDRAVHWVLGQRDVFLITSGDIDLLPMILDAASRFRSAPPEGEMAQMVDELGMQPLFT
jgi:aryl-alcohol dehydrogenase-like predicted oxidoreductase